MSERLVLRLHNAQQGHQAIQQAWAHAKGWLLAGGQRLVLEKRADKEKREKLKSKAQWAREAQTAFNAYIRLRDDADPCISCGRYHAGQYHAGHYLSVGARPELRFEPLNVHKQCAPCNSHLSGNIVLYRVALRTRIGDALVDWLEGPHPAKHYDIDALKAIKAEYTTKARELKKAMQ